MKKSKKLLIDFHCLVTLFDYYMEQPIAFLLANKTDKWLALRIQISLEPCQSKSEGSWGYEQQQNCISSAGISLEMVNTVKFLNIRTPGKLL